MKTTERTVAGEDSTVKDGLGRIARGRPASNSSRPGRRRLRRHGFALRLAGCFLSVSAATCIIEFFEMWKPDANMFWVANGMLLGYLLLAPRWRWPAYLAAGFCAISVRIVFLPNRWHEFLLYTLLDIVEVALAAQLLRPRSRQLPRFTERGYLVRFVLFAGLAAPAVAAGIYVLVYPLLAIVAPPHPFLSWMASDGPGMVVSAPAFIAVFQTRFRNAVNWRKNWPYPTLLLVVAMAAFMQSSVPMVYLIYPLLVLVVLRLGLGHASLFMLITTVIASWFTIRGSGPFAATRDVNPALPTVLLVVAASAAMLMIYSVSVVLANQKSAERRLQEIVKLHNLITENSRDAIMLSDFSGTRRYVSAAVERLVGYSDEEFAQQQSLDMVHPEDRPQAEAVVKQLRSGAEGAMIECRIRRRNGEYFWVEASLRVVRDSVTGAPAEILNIVRDISERKRSEEELQQAYRALEALAITDALTGLANRRRFDDSLANEWRRALRDARPLSLLLIDVDLFKSYNDTYGHPRGDVCLQRIAEAALEVVARPGDVVARFGGEEFAVLLPDTGNAGAMQIAHALCAAVKGRKLTHSANASGIVTVSVGCGTKIPRLGDDSLTLIELADQALYLAKRSGRDQVCNGSTECADAAEPQGGGAAPTLL